MLAIKRILAAVDHSEPSLRASEFAADIASKLDAALVLLTVARLPDSPDHTLDDYLSREHINEPVGVVITDAAHSELCFLRDRIAKTTGQTVTCEVVVGSAAEMIVSFASRAEVGLIAIGHVGHGRVSGLLLGSVAKRVVDTAHCPVLVVP
jgi:nucleotide-binding universal stress UspA family protein